jgi:hypothetical protein
MIECKHPKTVFVKLSRKDVSLVDMTAWEDLTPDPSPKERGERTTPC